jgi:putative nucleotidyltransferase with HDIG domain
MNLDATSNTTKQFSGLGQRKGLMLGAIALATFAGITLAQLSRYVIGAGFAYNRGDVAAVDIRAPHRMIYISEIETNRQRDLAEASVAPIFTSPDAQISRRQMSTAVELLDQIKEIRIAAISQEEKLSRLLSLEQLSVSEPDARLILQLNDIQFTRVGAQMLAVLDVALRAPIHPDNLDKARGTVAQLISFSLRADEADIVNRLASDLLVPNTNYDSAATDTARRTARESVRPVERAFAPNQIIIRSGQIVGQGDIEALDKFNLRRPALTSNVLTSAMLFSAIAVTTLALAMAHQRNNVFHRSLRQTAATGTIFVVTLLLARWLLPGHGVLPYLAPLAASAIAITSWSGLLPGVLSAVLMGVLVGMGMDKQMEFATCIAVSGAVACLTLGRAERLSNFLRAGMLAGLAQCLVVLAFNATTFQSNDVPLLVVYLIASFLSGMLAAGLALAALFISGFVLDITTVVQLIELARLSHPLLQQMVTVAPGTYHHSLMVANLAESAAERIGADSLLTRVGAYFHDVGKMANPHFFIENQLESLNPHEQLDPLTSSTILQNHVTDGLKLATRHRLPSRIRAFIAEHHGTNITSYQYAKALKLSDGPVDPKAFRYPGPRPQSKETALIMLADGSEAAVRSARCTTVEEMDEVIRRVFAERLADHQLDDSDLTLREMDVTRQSFLETLRGMYHPRIQYPQVSARGSQNAVSVPTTPANTNTSLPSMGDQEWAAPYAG